MFEGLYEIFFKPGDQNSYQAFVQYHGYDYASWVLLICNAIVGAFYYFYLGNQSPKYATRKKWGIGMVLSACVIYVFTVYTVGFISFQVQTLGEILPEVWLFGFVNFCFGVVFYGLQSMIFKYGSNHTRYTPL